MTTVSAFQTLSYIAEGCIFIYVGLDTLDPLKWKVRRHTMSESCRTLPCTLATATSGYLVAKHIS